MYLRRINRKKSGKSHYYWALVESYRTEKGSRQRIVGYIGDVSKRSVKSTKQALEPCYSYQQDFFSPEELPDKLTIQPNKTRTERQRQFGGVWLGDKLFSRLGLDDFFQEQKSAYTTFFKILIFSRFTCPSSELHIAEHLYEKSAMEDFLGVPVAKVYAQRLYRSLDKLLPCKVGTELKIRTVPRPEKPLQILLHRLGLSLPERLNKRVLW